MAKKEVDYNSLRGKLDKINTVCDSSYRTIKSTMKKGQGDRENFGTREWVDYAILGDLKAFNEGMNSGNFSVAKIRASDIYCNLQDDNSKNFSYTKEEKLKYLDILNKRIERGIKYLEKHPSKVNAEKMEDILKISERIESDLKKSSSGLEKATTVVSLIAIIGGMAIGYPALTGNVIAENVKNSITAGSMLFVLGLLGVFIANKK